MEVRRKQPKKTICATIILPTEQYSPGLEQVCATALQRACDMHIERINDELRSVRWEGRRTLFVGLLVWAVCLALALLLDTVVGISNYPRVFLSEGLIIVGWVALWYPAEVLLYDWLLHDRDKKVYQRMKEVEIHVECVDE